MSGYWCFGIVADSTRRSSPVQQSTKWRQTRWRIRRAHCLIPGSHYPITLGSYKNLFNNFHSCYGCPVFLSLPVTYSYKHTPHAAFQTTRISEVFHFQPGNQRLESRTRDLEPRERFLFFPQIQEHITLLEKHLNTEFYMKLSTIKTSHLFQCCILQSLIQWFKFGLDVLFVLP